MGKKHIEANKENYENSREGFICKVCGKLVKPLNNGGKQRNHCPYCLTSIHVDNNKGDRQSTCKGIMDVIAIWVKRNGEWAIIHRCRTCGKLSSNRIAFDDNSLKLISLAMKPISSIPFPVERIQEIDNI